MLGTWHNICLQSICTALTERLIIFLICHVHLLRLIFQNLILKMPSSCHQLVLDIETFYSSNEILLLLEYITLISVCDLW